MDTYIGPCGCDEARDPWTRCDACEASGWTPLSLLTPEERAAWALCEGAPYADMGDSGTFAGEVRRCSDFALMHEDGDCPDDARRFLAGASVALPLALGAIAALRAEVRRLRADALRARVVGLQEAAAFLGMAAKKMEADGIEDAPAGDVVAALIAGLMARAADGFEDELSAAAKAEIAAETR